MVVQYYLYLTATLCGRQGLNEILTDRMYLHTLKGKTDLQLGKVKTCHL
jgi:hypothetical protein